VFCAPRVPHPVVVHVRLGDGHLGHSRSAQHKKSWIVWDEPVQMAARRPEALN